MYVALGSDNSNVNVYDATWSLVTSIYDYGNGRLRSPTSAVISDQGYVIVADYGNSRVSLFTSDGQFVKHIIFYNVPYYESNDKPFYLSVRNHYLWISTFKGRLTRYIL